jgi:hypothetical protein
LFHAAAFLLMLTILLLIGGPTLVRKFLHGYFVGVDVYVFLTLDGKEIAYKNPKGLFGHEDAPLALVPHEVLYSDQFETYYNVCWFDCGALFRCGHSYHRTEENARYCDKNFGEGVLIGKVLEQR